MQWKQEDEIISNETIIHMVGKLSELVTATKDD